MGASFLKNWVQENDVITLAKRRKYSKKIFEKFNFDIIDIFNNMNLLNDQNYVTKVKQGPKKQKSEHEHEPTLTYDLPLRGW